MNEERAYRPYSRRVLAVVLALVLLGEVVLDGECGCDMKQRVSAIVQIGQTVR